MIFNKKGSISISINMIVVVVLAFVMLGLMLTLGRNIVASSGDTAMGLIGQTKDDIQNTLMQSEDPLYFSQREYDVKFNDRATFNFGVKNVNPTDADLMIAIDYIDDSGNPVPLNAEKVAKDETGGSFFWPKVAQKFTAGEGKVFDVQYRAPRAQSTYMFKFSLIADGDLDNPVSEQIIFINVI